MVRKSLQTGLLLGLLLAAALAAIPANEQAVRAIPGWEGLGIPWLPPETLRAFALAAGGLLLLLVGTLAAMRVRPDRLGDGFRAGALSGLVAGTMVYLLVVGPLIVLRAGGELLQRLPGNGGPPDPQRLADYLSRMVDVAGVTIWRSSMLSALVVPLAGLAVGGMEGLVYGLLRRIAGRRSAPEARPALLDQVRAGKPLRPAGGSEGPLRAGLLGGLLVGAFLTLELLALLTEGVLGRAGNLTVHAPHFSPHVLDVIARVAIPLLVLVPIVAAFWGGAGVLLLKDPATRFGARLAASAYTGITAGAIVAIFFVLPLANIWLATIPAAASARISPEGLPADPGGAVPFVFAFCAAFGLAATLVDAAIGFLLGLPFVLFSAHVWPRRPVDRAAGLAARLRRQPENTLPQLYGLFQRDGQAVAVLQHLARRLRAERTVHLGRVVQREGPAVAVREHGLRRRRREKSPPAGLIAAAYHTLYESPERTDAQKAIVDVLAAVPDWRWAGEVAELHRFLAEGRQARTMQHLAAVRPLPEEQTSSLPSVLKQEGEILSRVIAEVKKAHLMDDPNGRTIYLNRALEEVAAAQRAAAAWLGAGRSRGSATPYAEQKVLAILLPQWQEILHGALRDLRGRAVLKVELLTRQASYLPRLALHVRVANEGLNVAEQVRLGLDPAPGYQLTPGSEARIELLPPGEAHEAELVLEPRNPRAMRVLMHVFYNDAVEENRELALADEVVFVGTDRPFQRIFPIPYVTGTPLKTPEMFFGREDVFAYVREHLLGAYQNNIIVLHGQRRTGKTSVLYQLPRVMGETHYCVLLDMQGITARSEAEFFYALSDEIAYSLQREGVAAEVPPREDFEAQPEFTFRNRFLRGVYPLLGEKHLLLLFDEFEELQHHVEQGHIGTGVFAFLRNLMQHERPVDFVFSGTHKLEELAGEYWSILFNIATYKQISFLERSEVERLVVDPVSPYGMEYDPLAVEHIYAVTAGHPFLTQLVCHELVAYHNETERSYITVADVDVVLERIAERGEAHFKYVWAEADPAQRACLLALAELLAHTDGAPVEDVLALSERRGRPIDGETGVRAMVRLETRDVLVRTAPGSDRFRFRVDLVRRYIVRNPQLADAVG